MVAEPIDYMLRRWERFARLSKMGGPACWGAFTEAGWPHALLGHLVLRIVYIH